MEKNKNTKKTISQWVGVIITLATTPLLFTISILAGQEIAGSEGMGLILGLVILCFAIYLFALFISKITYFIIK